VNSVQQFATLLSYQKGKPPRKQVRSDRLVPLLSPEYLRGNVEPELVPLTPELILLNGDELILLWDGSNAGEFFRAKPGVLSSTMVAFSFDENSITRDFLFYEFKHFEPYLKGQTSGSGIPHVDKEILLSHSINQISKPSQIKIAQILSTIDHALEQTQALIAKYQRMKTGLMQDLLTRGIDEQGRLRDPSTHEFKDSRLGRIPVEWEVKTLAQIVPFHRPIVYGILMPGTGHENGIPVVKVKDIYDGKIHTDGLLLTSPKIHDAYKRSQIQTGDLLFTIRGTVGRMAFVPDTINGGNITQDTARVSIIGVNPEFVRSYLDMPIPRAFIELHTVGQAVQGINLEHVRQILVALPPRDEQDKISERLDAHRLTMNNLGNEVKKLETLKAGLMQDLLSGKKSVASLLEQTGTLETAH
jgi:type I restriction enzyme, S subunit